MSAALRPRALLRFESMLAAVLDVAARAYGAAPFAVCCVDLGDADGRRFALALHAASPTPLDPARFTGAAPLWCRAAPLASLSSVAAAVLGAEMSAAADDAHAAGAVPVVIVTAGVAMVEAFERAQRAS